MVVDAATAVGYSSAGTFEFLMDAQRQLLLHRGQHPPAGRARRHRTGDRHRHREGADPHRGRASRCRSRRRTSRSPGHAIECRINAENPDTFAPSPGRVEAFSLPGGPGIRVDTFVHAEATVPPNYDSLIAKVMSHGRDPRGSDRAHAARARDDGDRGHPHLGAHAPQDPGRRRFPARRGSRTAFMERFLPRPTGDDAGHPAGGLSGPVSVRRTPAAAVQALRDRRCRRGRACGLAACPTSPTHTCRPASGFSRCAPRTLAARDLLAWTETDRATGRRGVGHRQRSRRRGARARRRGTSTSDRTTCPCRRAGAARPRGSDRAVHPHDRHKSRRRARSRRLRGSRSGLRDADEGDWLHAGRHDARRRARQRDGRRGRAAAGGDRRRHARRGTRRHRGRRRRGRGDHATC